MKVVLYMSKMSAVSCSLSNVENSVVSCNEHERQPFLLFKHCADYVPFLAWEDASCMLIVSLR